MPGDRYQYFSVTGAASSTVSDSGLESTEEERRFLKSILIECSVHAGNRILVKIEREDIADVPDYLFVTRESSGSTNTQKVVNRRDELEINEEIPIGKRVKVQVVSGASATSITGAYRYSKL